MERSNKWLSWVVAVCAMQSVGASGQGMPDWNPLQFAQPQMWDAPKEVRDWVSFGMRDLDSDGYQDQIYAHDAGLVLTWGGQPGIQRTVASKSTFTEAGKPLRVLMAPKTQQEMGVSNPWDYDGEVATSGLPQFWVEWGGPRRVIGFSIVDREIRKIKEILLDPSSALAVTDGGILYGPDAQGNLLLEEFGVRRVLTRKCPPVKQMRYIDLDADGSRDLLIQKRNGDIGVAFGFQGELKGMHWLEYASGVAELVLTGHSDGRFSLLGPDASRKSLTAWEFRDGDWNYQSWFMPEFTEGLTRLYAFPWSEGKWLWLAEHFHDRSLLGVVADGHKSLEAFEIEDIEFVGAPQVGDENGDGALDLVYANVKANQLVVHPGLMPHKMPGQARLNSGHELLFWNSLTPEPDLLWPYFKPYPVECLPEFLNALPDSFAFQHLRCEAGQLYAMGRNSLMVATPADDKGDLFEELGLASAEPTQHHHALDIPHFRATAGLPTLEPDKWSHVLFTKSKSGKAEVHINGERVSSGWFRDEVEDLRILFLGCSNLGRKFRFFEGAIDEVMVFDRGLEPEAIREIYEAQRVLPETQPRIYFDFNANSVNPAEGGSHPLVFENGTGPLVPGIDGNAMSFDGRTTYASLFTEIPDEEVSISIWVKPTTRQHPSRQTFLGIYGDWNLDFDLLPQSERQASGPSSDLHMHAEFMELPAGGFAFRYGQDEYCLAADGHVHIRAGFDWKAVQTSGANPLDESAGLRGTPWIEDGKLNAVFGHCHMWYQFDPEEMVWSTLGRMNPMIKGFDFAIAGTTGVMFIRHNNSPQSWWKPKGENALYPVSAPAFGTKSVGVLANFDGFWWLDGNGAMDPPALMSNEEVIPLLKPELPVWMFMAGGLSLFLLMGGVWLSKSKGADFLPIPAEQFTTPAEPETVAILEIHRDLLFRLSEETGAGVDTTNLDVIFDIHHIETDETRRSRRSRLVKELNEWYEEEEGRLLIRREIDPEDRRRRIYVVDEALSEYLNRQFPHQFPLNGDQA